MSKKEREISEFETDLKFFGLHSNLSNDNIISARTGWHAPHQEFPGVPRGGRRLESIVNRVMGSGR